jgi:predicted PurR-regulated permease PerM
VTAFLQGTTVTIAFSIVGLQPALLGGVVTACVSILPIVGSALVWLPGTLVRLGGATRWRGGVPGHRARLASNIDNAIRPIVHRPVSGIHPTLTIIGAFAGVRLFGIVGAFVGPLALSYFFELLRVYEDAAITPLAASAGRA